MKFLIVYGEETPTQLFSCEICKNFNNNYFEEHLWTTDVIWYTYFSHDCSYQTFIELHLTFFGNTN